jgi:hypothetical protein
LHALFHLWAKAHEQILISSRKTRGLQACVERSMGDVKILIKTKERKE